MDAFVNNLRGSQVDRATTKDYDLHGRRVRNATASEFSTDYVIRSEIDSLRTQLTNAIAAASGNTSAGLLLNRYTLWKQEILIIQSNIVPNLYIEDSATPNILSTRVKFTVTDAPVGADLTIQIFESGDLVVPWMTLTLPDGGTNITATNVQIAGARQITTGNYWRVDITTVGTTFGGANLLGTIII